MDLEKRYKSNNVKNCSVTTVIDIESDHLIDHILTSKPGIHVISSVCPSKLAVSAREHFAKMVSSRAKKRSVPDLLVLSCEHTHDFHKALISHYTQKSVIMLVSSENLLDTIDRLRSYRATTISDLEKIKSITHADFFPINDCGDVELTTESALVDAGELTVKDVFSGYDERNFDKFKLGDITSKELIHSLAEDPLSFLERKTTFLIYNAVFGEDTDCFNYSLKRLLESDISITPITEHVIDGFICEDLTYEDAVSDIRFLLL